MPSVSLNYSFQKLTHFVAFLVFSSRMIDREGKVVYAQLVPEITEEPDYDGAAEAVRTH